MRKSAWLFLLLMCALAGCSSAQQNSLQTSPTPTAAPSPASEEQVAELTGDTPPSAWIEYEGERYDAHQGSYCWMGCLDTGLGPMDQLGLWGNCWGSSIDNALLIL